MRATTSASGLPIAAVQVGTSVLASQLRMAPSASWPASRSICGRSAASTTFGGGVGACSSLNRLMVNESNWPSTRSPASAVFTARRTSRLR